MIDYAQLKAWPVPEVTHRYDADFTMHYALSLGLGHDPMDERQLRFVSEVSTVGKLQALPTLAVVVAFPGSWMNDPATGIDFTQVVHGEERVDWFHPLPASGVVKSRHRITHVIDKGVGRGALVIYEKDVVDAETDLLYATVIHTTFARADGGFSAKSGLTDVAPPGPPALPDAPPDMTFDLPTLPQQALLYRLLADRNPLHSDPATARAAGFERPILHGLCTWGMAGHAMLQQFGDNDPARLKSLFARFSAPVIPGEPLRLEVHHGADRVQFRVQATQRGKTVLDRGYAVFA